MEKDIIKKITLKPVKCIRQSKQNPYMHGKETDVKSDLTVLLEKLKNKLSN